MKTPLIHKIRTRTTKRSKRAGDQQVRNFSINSGRGGIYWLTLQLLCRYCIPSTASEGMAVSAMLHSRKHELTKTIPDQFLHRRLSSPYSSRSVSYLRQLEDYFSMRVLRLVMEAGRGESDLRFRANEVE